MMRFDAAYFDRQVERRGPLCEKWDGLGRSYGNPDALPMWVADMDIPCPPAVVEALKARVEHGIFGYTMECPEDRQSVVDFLAARHAWHVEPESLVWSPSVLSTLKVAIQLFTEPGDGVIVQPPIYPPFLFIPESLGRRRVLNPLRRTEDGWKMDLENLEDCLRDGAKALMLCSPHNPVGRVWSREELEQLVALLRRYDAKLIADEIHHDLIMPGHTQTSVMTLGVEDMAIVGISATKTFNLAGLEFSTAVIPDAGLRQRFIQTMQAYGSCAGNLLSRMAQRTAYQQGIPWLEGLLAYLDDARRMLREVLERDFPGVEMSDLQGTYLAWLDFTAYTQDPQRLWQWAAQAGVAVGKGHEFMGPGFARFNLACPHAQLLESLDRLHAALPQLRESR